MEQCVTTSPIIPANSRKFEGYLSFVALMQGVDCSQVSHLPAGHLFQEFAAAY